MEETIKIYLDTARLDEIRQAENGKIVSGYTTNPSIMKKDGVENYTTFARQVLDLTSKPVSFEIFSDHPSEIVRQARVISSWGPNVYVKVPVVTSQGWEMYPVIDILAKEGIKLNVTAVFTQEQIILTSKVVANRTPCIISVFAGRIADTGRSPSKIIEMCRSYVSKYENQKLLWASTRELYNVVEAQKAGCDIITVTPDVFAKFHLRSKTLEQYAMETSAQFLKDALSTGYKI